MKTTKDQTWLVHMQTGRILEDINIGNYRMVFIKVTQQSSFIHYHYRLIAFPSGSSEPILSLNLESNPMARTLCLGAHLPEGHDNLGFVDENMSEGAFRTWAFDIAKKYLGLTQSPPSTPIGGIRISDDDDQLIGHMHTSTADSFHDIGSKLLELPAPGAVTDYARAHLLEATTPNVSNAWTYEVPALSRYAKNEGKRSLFGRDKGKMAFRKLAEDLYLVVLGLYGDKLLTQGASTDECLLALLHSLVSFKEAYPNWTDAYSVAYRLFVKERDIIKIILAKHQRSVEAKLY